MTLTLPAWFSARQEAAKARYESLPTPKRGHEEWRFANFKQLDFSGFSKPSFTVAGDLVSRSEGLEAPVAKFVFVNDELAHSESALPENVVCLPLADALASHADLVEKHFMKQETRLGSAKYAAWHEASVTNGLFVHVPDNVEVKGTIEVHHWISGKDVVVFPHTLIVTGKHAKVRVVDIFRSADEEAALAVAFNDLSAGPGSKLDYVAIQAVNEHTRIIQINETGAHRDASTIGLIVNTGASWVRNESLARLEGPGARSEMLSVSIPSRNTTSALSSTTFPKAPTPTSFTRTRSTTDLILSSPDSSSSTKARTIPMPIRPAATCS
jgi:Fe-S cluster assembly protein SufD